MHKKFQGQRLNHDYFTNDLVECAKCEYMLQTNIPNKIHWSQKSGKIWQLSRDHDEKDAKNPIQIGFKMDEIWFLQVWWSKVK